LQALALPITEYSWTEISKAFDKIKQTWPDSVIRAAVYNAASWSRAPFLELKEAEVQESVDVNMCRRSYKLRRVIV
jgi:hypothetical protein